MKLSKAHQAAVDVLQHEQREKLAYHHALVAKLNGSIQRVGSTYDRGDSTVWLIAFSPRLRDAVIVETFTSHDYRGSDRQVNTKVFWLDDVRNYTWANLKMQELYSKAVQMQMAEYNKDAAA